MRFWGTSAGEAIPTPFCECRICKNARRTGGREVRLRSCFRVDGETMIDPGADFTAEAIRLGESMYGLRNVIYTHTHEDHFNFMLPWTRFVARVKPDWPLQIYFTADAYDILDKFYLTSPYTAGREGYTGPRDVVFRRLEFGETCRIGGMDVTPLRGNHRPNIERNSANYLLRLADGRTLYYGLDTGYYLEETFAALAALTSPLDILISECTSPTDGGDENAQHMNLPTLLHTLDRLYAQHTIGPDTAIWLTHIAPVGMTGAELCDWAAKLDRPYRVGVAYDGMYLN